MTELRFGLDFGTSNSAIAIWDGTGVRLLPIDPIAPDELDVLRALRVKLDGPLCEALQALISVGEMRALIARVDRLLRTKRFPEPDPYRMAVPWPPF